MINTVVKRIAICGLLFFSSYLSHAQTLLDYDLIKLEKPADYKKAEPFALQTVNFFLMVPYKNSATEKERGKAIEFLAKWMIGSAADYPALSLLQVQQKITKSDVPLLEMYLVSMIKYAIENKEAARDAQILRLNSFIKLLDYCEKKDNNIKMNKQVKKLSEARIKGELGTVLVEMLK